MKKLNVMLAVCTMFILVGFTKQSLAEMKKTGAEKKSEIMQATVFAGKVDSISASDLVVTNKAGKKHTFVLESSTKVIGSNDAASTIDHVKAGNKVRVKYTTENGKEDATSVHILQ